MVVYKEDEETREKKSEIAEQKPRDAEGHFIPTPEPVVNPPTPTPPTNPFSKILSEVERTKLLSEVNGQASVVKSSSDDLLDVHVGNPLRKIVVLLEDIKKQKAFSFTLKGSLGIAGVALALGVFGVFGGGQILCERGVQSQIGEVKVLDIKQESSAKILVIDNLLNLLNPKELDNRVVLIRNNETALAISYSKNVDVAKFINHPVIVTGSYNSCSQTITVNDAKGLQIYTK